MPKKQKTHTLTRIRQHDDLLETWDELDELAQDERIRRQPHDEQQPSGGIKQERRKREKAWGRAVNRSLRKMRQNEGNKP
jgi:hypothetical protein